ncbi:response regulator [Cellulomonas oligotrophica]|uniref:DNA-binding NarL/FixJ family response regulator n=1 Tax=Cellulomonas oligotrophica TaxID=931536 RepID=A0A7Y9FIA1_9CELL|nr:response regulator transcription factor [Cellulomonas oligotrophica]NYD87427.1 DNA-binding NarL/FixJ family response regulator [Cellulomonas oligotrophica]GIG34095.1 DNA-binding response regulator [Cellulomonas oligotrophica]
MADADRGAAGTVRVVLADDQALLRAGIGTILSAHPRIEVVGEAGTGAEAVDLVRTTRPDVVCMDVQMPDMDGLEATRRIVADPAVDAAVVVLTTFNREDYLLEALQAGAVGYLLKTSRPEQLTEAVLSAAAGDALLAPEVTRTVIERALAERAATAPSSAPVARPSSPGPLTPLTEREAEVLGLVARGLSNDEIAAELVVSRATVKTHVSAVLAKLGLRDRVQAVVWAHEHGVVG